MAPTNSFLLLAVLSGVTSALYTSPYPSRNSTDANNTPNQLEWAPCLTVIAVLSALLCLSNMACCLLSGGVLALCRERGELLRERQQKQNRTVPLSNPHTATSTLQLGSLKSPHIYCNIESLRTAGRGYSPGSPARPYPGFSSPVTYEELDVGGVSCEGSQGLESYYTVFTDLTLTQ